MPELDVDLAKSRILDTPYTFAIGKDGEVIETGRPKPELQRIGEALRSGGGYEFPPDELARVLQLVKEFRTLTPKKLFVDAAKWLAPPLALALIAALLLWKK